MSKDLTEALAALTKQARQRPEPRPQPRGSAPRQTAAATPGAPAASEGGSGGIASPLTEATASNRVYWPAGWKTTDGLFTFPAIRRVNMVDADGASVILDFAEPSS